MNYLIKSNEMKTVFITYGQAHDEAVIETLEKLEIRGFTRWDGIDGKVVLMESRDLALIHGLLSIQRQ